MLNLIDKNLFKIFFFLLILAEILSYFGWLNYWVNAICFVVIILATVILSLKKLEYGLYILFAELFVGSKGYLFSLNLGGTILSIRMGIFLAVMGVWVTHELLQIIKRIDTNKLCHSVEKQNPEKNNLKFLDPDFRQDDKNKKGEDKEKWFLFKKNSAIKLLIAFSIILLWSFFWGIIRGNDFGNVFLDFNNWLYFLVALPVFCVIENYNHPVTCGATPPLKGGDNKHKFINNIISILSAAVLLIGIKTLILFYIFTHQIFLFLPEVYKWVRDTGVGEITNMGGGFYRVFMQSQIYSLLAFFILFCHTHKPFCHSRPVSKHGVNSSGNLIEQRDPHFREDDKKKKDDKKKIDFALYLPRPASPAGRRQAGSLLITTFVTIILSFSRSYWLGLMGGLAIYFFYSLCIIRNSPASPSEAGRALFIFFKFFSKVVAVAMISFGLIATLLYLPPKIKVLDWTSVFGKRATQGEAASSSRINQLKPLLLAISKHPLIGSGFGTTVTYKSNDPRIVNETAGRSGLITTYAFEWGYFDMVLKFGLLGAGIYLFLIFKILRRLLKLQITKLVLNLIQDYKLQINPNIKIQNSYFLDPVQLATGKFELRQDDNEENYSLPASPAGRLITHYSLQFSFALALIALLVVNIFSPYLNHPLGIGFIILSLVFMF